MSSKTNLNAFPMEKGSRYFIRKLSTIDNIPDEILCRIFLQTVNDSPAGIDICDPLTPIRCVMQVSSRWRSLAFSYPILWSRILLEYRKAIEDRDSEDGYGSDDFEVRDPYDGLDSRIEIWEAGPFLEQCLSLSRECRLHITIEGRFYPGLLDESCLKALAQSSYRWDSFNTENVDLFNHIALDVSDPSHEYISLRKLRLAGSYTAINIHPAPNLTKLDVYNVDLEKAPVSLQSAPSLTHLCLHLAKNYLSILPFIPLHQITHLSFRDNTYYYGGLLALTGKMPNLQFLEFGGEDLDFASPCMVVPNVKSFKLHMGKPGSTDHLDRFSMPQLKHLEFRVNVSSYDNIIQFLRQSKCSLESLKLGALCGSDQQWLDEELNELKILNVDMTTCYIYGFDGQIRTMEILRNPHVFPNIERLEIVTPEYPEERVEGLAGKIVLMLRSRLPSIAGADHSASSVNLRNSALKYVRVKFPLTPSEDESEVVKDFLRSDCYDIATKAGVDIKFSYDTEDQWSVTYDAY